MIAENPDKLLINENGLKLEFINNRYKLSKRQETLGTLFGLDNTEMLMILGHIVKDISDRNGVYSHE